MLINNPFPITEFAHTYGPSLLVAGITSATMVRERKRGTKELIQEIRRVGEKLGPDSCIESGTCHIEEKPKSVSDDAKDTKSMIPINGHHVASVLGENEKLMECLHSVLKDSKLFNDLKRIDGRQLMNALGENIKPMRECPHIPVQHIRSGGESKDYSSVKKA
ncbi:unnamed protein product [Tuber melanosporum]|uniref:(Perigord truffle) hypothetical protein n=1 Tax=Tuber melanosporum (strain Mel28) TaxID=656061 RepID=D5GBM0_TUBMM|nr:uncharacterized protein GSTUM_00005702001 [Tuber melanosporum]CAZ82026.1 unnamed protein product [Tuber melanosporum]